MRRDSEEESGFTLLLMGLAGLIVFRFLMKADEPVQVAAGDLQLGPRCASCRNHAWDRGLMAPQFERGEWHHPACARLSENAWRARGVPR